ncbi:CHRD domain-containing protein [Streptomyces sp. NPDC050610]|uniref:CHRD domain-containing protein n=1 Tax=Streptomyces sp. NPDC050610 TaxID=3157097 RepID=UPI003414CBFF
MNRFTVVVSTAAVVAVTAAGVTFAARSGDASGSPSGGSSNVTGSGTSRSGAVSFAAGLNGLGEVPEPGGPAADDKNTGDKDGKALAFLRVHGGKVSFALQYRGIAAPTAAHVHQGEKGANGDVAIPLFTKKLADGRTSVSGTVTVKDGQLLKDLASDPSGFYVNVHTGEFPGGAVRGQLHRLSVPLNMSAATDSFQASVTRGSQIYACTRQPGGGYAFTPYNVRAALGGGIAHSFTRPAGSPQWVAPDGSAVTGEVLAKSPNGTGNIPELDLRATRSGTARADGLLADTVEILRLNTVGGTAPAGTCDPARQPTISVPYQADYLFVGG